MPRLKQYNVITPVGMKPKPDDNEQTIAELMATHFKSDIKFVLRTNVATTPDILVVRYKQRWEIKNIKGNGKRTMQNNLRAADDQSQNIIICLLETKMTQQQALGRIRQFYGAGPVKIKKLLLVTKEQKVLVVKSR